MFGSLSDSSRNLNDLTDETIPYDNSTLNPVEVERKKKKRFCFWLGEFEFVNKLDSRIGSVGFRIPPADSIGSGTVYKRQ